MRDGPPVTSNLHMPHFLVLELKAALEERLYCSIIIGEDSFSPGKIT